MKEKNSKPKTIVPFRIYSRTCPVCGNTRAITFTNRFNDCCERISQTRGLYDARCIYCGKEYIVEWDDNGKPSLIDKKYALWKFEHEFSKFQQRDVNAIMLEKFRIN